MDKGKGKDDKGKGKGYEGRVWPLSFLGVYWGYFGVIYELYRDNGKENGNYYSGLGFGAVPGPQKYVK